MILIEAAHNVGSNTFDEVAPFLTDVIDEPEDEQDTVEFETWVCELLDLYDDKNLSHDAYLVNMNLTDLPKAVHDLSTSTTFAVYNNLLFDTSAPKSMCCDYWL